MNKDYVTKGESLVEIKEFVDSQYKLDIPVPFLKKIINKISASVNTQEREYIKLYNDGSFIITDFVFADFEEVISKQETEVEVLSQAFNSFLLIRGESSDNHLSIFDFLDTNRASLSKYFVNHEVKAIHINDSIHADFIDSIKDQRSLYETLKKVYLGSIISGYLEINVGQVKSEVEFLLDTNFIIGLLDLSSKESNHTCKKIIEICNRLGYKISVLDDTISETSNLLKSIAYRIESSILSRKVDKENIESACHRRKLSKTDLQRLAANLQEELVDLGFIIIANTNSYREEAKYSKVHEKFKQIRNTPQAALHDATAVTYVRKKRGRPVSDFYEAKCWFVTNTQNPVAYYDNHGFVPEIIRAEDLVNILWLTSPNVSSTEIIDVGLTRLISSAYSNTLPSNRLLRQLDEKIDKYAKGVVSPRDIVLLANAVADRTVKNLDRLEEATEDNFAAEIQIAARDEEAKQRRRDELTNALIAEKSLASEKRIEQIKSDLIQRSQHDLDEIATRLTSVHSREILTQKLEFSRSRLRDLSNERDLLIVFNNRYTLESDKYATKATVIAVVLIPIILIALMYKIGWDTFEPITYAIGLTTYTFAFLAFKISKKEFSYDGLQEIIQEKRLNNLYNRYNFNPNRILEIDQEVISIESSIKTYKQALVVENDTISLL
jgi:hypothetical protein